MYVNGGMRDIPAVKQRGNGGISYSLWQPYIVHAWYDDKHDVAQDDAHHDEYD